MKKLIALSACAACLLDFAVQPCFGMIALKKTAEECKSARENFIKLTGDHLLADKLIWTRASNLVYNYISPQRYIEYAEQKGFKKTIIVGGTRVNHKESDKYKYLFVRDNGNPDVVCDIVDLKSKSTSFGEGMYDTVIFEHALMDGFTSAAVMGALNLLKPGGRLISDCYYGNKKVSSAYELIPEEHLRVEKFYLKNDPNDSWYWFVTDNYYNGELIGKRLANLCLCTNNKNSTFYSSEAGPNRSTAELKSDAIKIFEENIGKFKEFLQPKEEKEDMIEKIEFKNVTPGTEEWPEQINKDVPVMIITKKK